MKYDNEKIFNKILLCSVCFIYFFIAIFFIFVLGISRVEAAVPIDRINYWGYKSVDCWYCSDLNGEQLDGFGYMRSAYYNKDDKITIAFKGHFRAYDSVGNMNISSWNVIARHQQTKVEYNMTSSCSIQYENATHKDNFYDVYMVVYCNTNAPISANSIVIDFGLNKRSVSNYIWPEYFVVNSSLDGSSITDAINDQGNKIMQNQNQNQQHTDWKLGDIHDAIGGTNDRLDNIDDKLGDINGFIQDSSVDIGVGIDFFNEFSTSDSGLASIIGLPKNFLNSLTSSSCNTLDLEIPFVNKEFSLPCMLSIYRSKFNNFLTIYQVITFCIVAYWCCVNLSRLKKETLDLGNDRIEVLDL